MFSRRLSKLVFAVLLCSGLAVPVALAQITDADRDRAHGRNFLLNPGFSDWNEEERELPGWKLTGLNWVKTEAVKDGEGSDLLVKLSKNADEAASISQRVYSDVLRPNEMLMVSVEVNVGRGDAVSLAVRHRSNNVEEKNVTYRAHHYGDGWRTLHLMTERTEDVGYFEIRVDIKTVTTSPIRIRNPSAVIVPVVP